MPQWQKVLLKIFFKLKKSKNFNEKNFYRNLKIKKHLKFSKKPKFFQISNTNILSIYKRPKGMI